jgi:agmatine deiminase
MKRSPSKTNKTPRQLGYTFPPEWHPQLGTWMSWPRPEGISFPDRYHRIGAQLCEIVRQIASRQDLHINVPNGNWERIVRQTLADHDVSARRVHFHHIKTNEAWCRDHGPAFLIEQSRVGMTKPSKTSPPAVIDWGFNAWGGKYPPYDSDDAVPTHVAKTLKIKKVFAPQVIMEGGAVDFNGAGTILTTTDCLLNKNRNPSLSKSQIEDYLKSFYGQTHVCWLTGGIEGDDTDGHIDDLARFISPTQIVFGVESNQRDVNYTVLKRVRGQLDRLRDQDGQPFEIIELPMPKAVVIDGQRCPATYMNFLFVNGAVLVPVFGQKSDEVALSILKQHLPRHEVIGINCSEIIWGLGAIHCLTQQMPCG